MATNDKDPNSPATTSDAYDAMLPRWQLISDVLGGTETMRAAAERHLPKHEEETDEGYRARLATATLKNVTEQTLDNLAGKPFCEELKPNEDVPEDIVNTIFPDVDLQGNSISVVTRNWFREGLAKAFCHMLIDMPKIEPRADGQPRTLADDRRDGVRPYWVLVKPECVLFAAAKVVNGVETLTEVRIMEHYKERDGFSEITKQRIRVLYPGMVQIWIPSKQKRANKEVWIKYDEWKTALDYIPLVTFYATRDELCYAKPPLLDLAHLNIAHWQSTADQRHILKVARFPILACSGASKDESDPVTVGPNKVLYNDDPQGKFYYVEHQGNAIEAGRKDLEDLERQMAEYGTQFLEDQPGDQTATAKAIDSAEANSSLASMVGRFEDAIAQALTITADWMKLGSEGGTIELEKDFGPDGPDNTGLDALDKARGRRDISRKTYLEGLRQRGVLPEDFDPEADQVELTDEMDALMAATGMNLDPLSGKPVPPQGPPTKKPAAKKAPAKA